MAKRKLPRETMYYTYRQENPKGKSTGDCVIRALASAMEKDWDTVYDDLYKIGKKYKLMPNDEKCYERYLKANGWVRQKQPRDEFNKKLTGEDFCEFLDLQHKRGEKDESSVIVSIGSRHLSMVEWSTISGFTFCDSWNCTQNCVGKYWTR